MTARFWSAKLGEWYCYLLECSSHYLDITHLDIGHIKSSIAKRTFIFPKNLVAFLLFPISVATTKSFLFPASTCPYLNLVYLFIYILPPTICE